MLGNWSGKTNPSPVIDPSFIFEFSKLLCSCDVFSKSISSIGPLELGNEF